MQEKTSLSTPEAEYVAASACCQDVMWLRHLLGQITCLREGQTWIWEDNTGCIAIAANRVGMVRGRTKHIALKYHYVRECYESKDVFLDKVASTDNTADILTKPLEKVLFRKHARELLHEVVNEAQVDVERKQEVKIAK